MEDIQYERQPNTFLARKIAAGSLAVSLALGVSGCANAESFHLPAFITGDYTSKECDVVTKQTLDETKQLFDDSRKAADTNGNRYITQEAHDAYRIRVAQKLGVTVYDPFNEFEALNFNALSNDVSDIPTKQYLAAAETMLARYGIAIEYGSDEVKSGAFPGVTGFSKADIIATDDPAIKYQLNSVIQSIGELPVELVRYMGLKKVVLVHIGKTKAANGEQAAAFAELGNPDPDAIYIDPTEAASDVIPHEMLHLWDAKECGPIGMDNDTQYDALNPQPTQKGAPSFYKAHTGYLSPTDAGEQESTSGLYLQLKNAQTAQERATILAQIEAIEARVAVADEYGFSAIYEDKATIGEKLLSPLTRSLIDDNDSPIVQNKSMLLAARIFEDQPKSIAYLAQTSLTPPTLADIIANQ